MAFKINDFKRALTFGGARASLFQVEITLPDKLTDSVNNGIDGRNINGVEEKITFLCNASSIPASEIKEMEVAYFGRKVKLPGERTFQPWSMTVLNDEDFLVRKTFEHWMASINGHSSNIRNSGFNAGPSSYEGTAIIKQFSKGPVESAIRAYKLVNCFPTMVDPIELSWDSNDKIQEVKVTLAYDWWEIDTSGDITPPEGNGLA